MTHFLRIAFCSVVLLLGTGLANANRVECTRDINHDGVVNQDDFKILENAMGSIVGAAPYDERADVNQDDRVDQDDRAAYKHCASPAPPAKPAGRAFGTQR